MPVLKIILDTNALLRSISRRSAYAISFPSINVISLEEFKKTDN